MILRGNGGLLAGPAPSFRLYGTAAGSFQTIIPAGPAGFSFAFAMKAKRPQAAQIAQLSRLTAKVMKQPDQRSCGPLPRTSGTIGSALPFGLVAWSTGMSVSAN